MNIKVMYPQPVETRNVLEVYNGSKATNGNATNQEDSAANCIPKNRSCRPQQIGGKSTSGSKANRATETYRAVRFGSLTSRRVMKCRDSKWVLQAAADSYF